MVDYEIVYKDFKVVHPVGVVPKLIMRFNFNALVEEDLAIYVPILKWEAYLNSANSIDTGGMTFVGDWGSFESIGAAKLFTKKKTAEIFCEIPMDSQKIQQIVNIRFRNKVPILGIKVRGHYLTFESKERLYLLESIRPIQKDVTMYYKDRTILHVCFSSDEIIKLLEDLGQYELFRIEIPVGKKGKSSNKLIAEVVEILDIAKKDLYDGKYDGVLKGVRDALANRILKKDIDSGNRWILNSIIEEDFMKNAPLTAKEEYAEYIKRIGMVFHSQLQIINNVYMHKKKPRVTPRPIDVEQIYLITAQLIRYLSMSCNLV